LVLDDTDSTNVQNLVPLLPRKISLESPKRGEGALIASDEMLLASAYMIPTRQVLPFGHECLILAGHVQHHLFSNQIVLCNFGPDQGSQETDEHGDVMNHGDHSPRAPSRH
jgi:hypothetical protein